jgi:hypothetical protein
MMARVGRIAGSLLLETDGHWFLVGNPKEPCDLIEGNLEAPYVRALSVEGFELSGTWLIVEGEGETLARELAHRLVIERNGSVSERLWRLVTDGKEGETDARWLTAMPLRVWQVVRDTVLRCS